jgi:hypothetical protein
MYIFEAEETIDIKATLKSIAEGLGYSYIEKNAVVNVNGMHTGTIQVGAVKIKIVYQDYVQEITTIINGTNFDCTGSVKTITNLSVDLQTASMIVKSIQDSGLMD